MSAKFIWVRNPTAINGLATTYVSLRGSDTDGDGTAQNPYRSLAKATTVAATNTNIMVDNGEWKEARTANGRNFKWWGNATSYLNVPFNLDSQRLNYLKVKLVNLSRDAYIYIYNCICENITGTLVRGEIKNTIAVIYANAWKNMQIDNCVLHGSLEADTYGGCSVKNTIFTYIPRPSRDSVFYNCNFTKYSSSIPTAKKINCIDDILTEQNLNDYFNYVPQNYVNSPNIYDFFACDFTAKPGSANIGAGTNDSNIGFNQGYPARATNDSNDIFAAANGATLRNVAWNATLNGYSLVHKDKVCAGYTVNTITLAADAEATDDYYNGLFIGITAGDGAGEIHRIVDYDGATRVATIDTSWQSAISTSSVYSISGTIDSATKDFGRVIKVKRNWAFLANMQSWTDPNDSSYGRWKEFLTSPLQNNGEWMMRPCSNFRYEYSIDNIEWHSSTELLAGTDSDNKTYNAAYGNASESYVAANAKTTVLRYVRYHIEIGFNIGEDAQ